MKYVKININSARKNPELNPKISMVEQLRPYSKNSRAFITFTNINKVGINPSSTFNTPLGIYAYPLRAFWSNIEEDTIPFGSDRPYVSLLLVNKNAKILNNNYSWNDYDQDLLKLYDFCEKRGLVKSKQNFISLRDFSYEKYPFRVEGKPVFYLWSFARYIALLLSHEEEGIKNVTKWSFILNKILGYAGAIDFRGWGFIHPNEPKQAVFFSIKAFSDTKTFLNKRYEERRNGITNKNFKYTKFTDNILAEEVLKINPSLNKKTFYASDIIARPVKVTSGVKVAIVSGTIEKGSIISDCILGEPHNVGKHIFNASEYKPLNIGVQGNTGKVVKLINCEIISHPGFYKNTQFHNCVIDGGFIDVEKAPCAFINCEFKKTSSRFEFNGFSFVDVFEYKVAPTTVKKNIDSLFANKKNVTMDEIYDIINILKENIGATLVRPLLNDKALNQILRGESPLGGLFSKE